MYEMKFLNLSLFVGLFCLTACTKTGLAILNFPSNQQVDIVRDISFGSEEWQKLDMYLPKKPWTKAPDVVVFFYGGRWEGGQRQDYKFIGEAFAKRGFIIVIPDYRKYPQVKFPAFVEDAALSFAWVYRHAEKYGGNKDRIHLSGHSAGAHIASLLASNLRYLKKEGLERSVIYDFAGLAGPYSFTPDEADLIDMFGPPSKFPDMQATSFIDGKQPPMLLLHGADDKTVGIFNLEKMISAISVKGGCVESKIYPGLSHISILTNASSLLGKDGKPVFDDMAAFFNRGDKDKCD